MFCHFVHFNCDLMLYCMLYFVFFLKSFDFHVVFTNWPWTHPADNQCNEPQVMASAGVTLFFQRQRRIETESVGEERTPGWWAPGTPGWVLWYRGCQHQDGGHWEWWVLGTLGTLVTKDAGMLGGRAPGTPVSAYRFCKFAKSRKSTISNSSQAISPICNKLCTQHLWTLQS